MRDDGNLEVWARPLTDSGRAVVLFNRSEKPANIEVRWPELGYPASVSLTVRDVNSESWRRLEAFLRKLPAQRW